MTEKLNDGLREEAEATNRFIDKLKVDLPSVKLSQDVLDFVAQSYHEYKELKTYYDESTIGGWHASQTLGSDPRNEKDQKKFRTRRRLFEE